MKNKIFKKSHTQTKFLCYNGVMLKTKTKVKIGFVSVLSIAAGVQASTLVAQQALAENTTFQVNVVESLSVSVTTDSSESTGGINTFLRSPVTLEVTSNNSSGFNASMHSVDNTNLVSGSNSIPTLTGSVAKSEFQSNTWGFSLQNELGSNTEASTGDNAAGKDSSMYEAMTASASSPITLMSRTTAASGTQKVWFGTKASATQASGEYENKVIFNVVSGVTEAPNADPVNPATPETDDTSSENANDNKATYTGANTTTGGSTNGVTVGTARYQGTTAAGGETETTKTLVTSGDTRSSYTDPQGVVEDTTSNINSGAPLATGLAVTAAVAATSGLLFFILAKRKKDDENEDEELTQ